MGKKSKKNHKTYTAGEIGLKIAVSPEHKLWEDEKEKLAQLIKLREQELLILNEYLITCENKIKGFTGTLGSQNS
jgi:hypothetical protein